MNMDSDKASVAAMSRIVKEKDSQIEELSEQLKVYADDLDNNAAIIEDLRAEIQKCEFYYVYFLIVWTLSQLCQSLLFLCYMSLVVRKPVFGVSDQVRHKPGCTVTEDG